MQEKRPLGKQSRNQLLPSSAAQQPVIVAAGRNSGQYTSHQVGLTSLSLDRNVRCSPSSG